MASRFDVMFYCAIDEIWLRKEEAVYKFFNRFGKISTSISPRCPKCHHKLRMRRRNRTKNNIKLKQMEMKLSNE